MTGEYQDRLCCGKGNGAAKGGAIARGDAEPRRRITARHARPDPADTSAAARLEDREQLRQRRQPPMQSRQLVGPRRTVVQEACGVARCERSTGPLAQPWPRRRVLHRTFEDGRLVLPAPATSVALRPGFLMAEGVLCRGIVASLLAPLLGRPPGVHRRGGEEQAARDQNQGCASLFSRHRGGPPAPGLECSPRAADGRPEHGDLPQEARCRTWRASRARESQRSRQSQRREPRTSRPARARRVPRPGHRSGRTVVARLAGAYRRHDGC